jgi:hypothetical protein
MKLGKMPCLNFIAWYSFWLYGFKDDVHNLITKLLGCYFAKFNHDDFITLRKPFGNSDMLCPNADWETGSHGMFSWFYRDPPHVLIGPSNGPILLPSNFSRPICHILCHYLRDLSSAVGTSLLNNLRLQNKFHN